MRLWAAILCLCLLGCPPAPCGTKGTITMVERRFDGYRQHAYVTVKYDNGIEHMYGPYDATILETGFLKAGKRVVSGPGLYFETTEIDSQLDPTKAEHQ